MPQYSQRFKYALDTLREIEKYPFLAEKLAQEITYKDFKNTLRIYKEDMKNKPDNAG